MSDPTELPPRLSVQGSDLIKPNGKTIFLHGVSFGAWGEDQPEDAQPVADLGANCVRIALRWHGLFSDPTVDARDNLGFAFLSSTHFTHWLDLITAASEAGLWVIPFIDSDCGQSGTQSPEVMRYCDPYQRWGARGRNFYTDPSLRKLFTTIVWPAAAARLRLIPRIAMLELHAEPAPDRGPEYTPSVQQVYRECMDAVRAVDADTPFLVGARGGYAIQHVDEAFLTERRDCVYTGNLLDQWVSNPDKFDEGLEHLLRLRDDEDVPVFCQQMGRKSENDPSCSLMARAVQRMREEDVGYAWWQWKQNTDSPDRYALHYKGPQNTWVEKTDEVNVLREGWT